jgi:hypothetical protein
MMTPHSSVPARNCAVPATLLVGGRPPPLTTEVASSVSAGIDSKHDVHSVNAPWIDAAHPDWSGQFWGVCDAQDCGLNPQSERLIMPSDTRSSRFGAWIRETASGAARAMGTPAGVNVDLHKAYCPTRNGIPDFSGGECQALPGRGTSAERR